MSKLIKLELNLDDAEVECLQERVDRYVSSGIDESCDDVYGIEQEIRYIIGEDIAAYDIYSDVRHDSEVRKAIKSAVREAIRKDLESYS